MISLLVISVGMLALGIFESQGRTVVLSFGVILLLLAGVIHLVIRKLGVTYK